MNRLISILLFGCFFINLYSQTQISKDNVIQITERNSEGLYIVDGKQKYKIDQRVVTVKKKNASQPLKSNIKQIRSNRLGYVDVEVPDGTDIEKYVKTLKQSGVFETVEYNSVGEFLMNPNDSYVASQWHLNRINAYSAWNISTGSSNIKVAVIDSGVDAGHEDLGYGYDTYANVDTSISWDYLNNTNYVVPTYYHGTFVAGIIGAKTNNNVGIAGLAGGNSSNGITILSYCIGNADTFLSASVGDAIIDAIDNGAKVINLSFGVAETSEINAAITEAYNNNVAVVCAVGNNNNSYISYPSSHMYSISVGAINENNVKASFSNYGSGLDFVAPGTNITSTSLNNGYDSNDGTSFSAPQVSGIIALMFSVNPYLTIEQIKGILQETSTDLGTTGYDMVYGYGLVNASAALSRTQMSIEGPSNSFGTNVYSVQNLPDGFTVSWSFNRTSGATTGWTLQVNAPVANQCTFSYTTKVALSGTLTAAIYKDSILVRSINKTLEYTPMYLGTYYQNDTFHNTNPQNTPVTAFYDGQHLTVIPKCNVYIDFDIPVGYGVYHSGDNLLEWTNNGQGSVVLRFPYSRTQWQYQTIYGTYQNQNYEFYVDCRPDDGFIDDPILDLDYYGDNLVITLIKADAVEPESSDNSLDGTNKANSGDDAWNLSIVNAITGRQVYSCRVNGESQRLSTTSWAKGLYVVRAQFDGQSLSQKIVIR